MKGVIDLFKFVLRFLGSFFDFEKIKGGYVDYWNYIEFNGLVHYHVIKLVVLLILLMFFIVLFIRSTRKTYTNRRDL